jgi:hypothetical protein
VRTSLLLIAGLAVLAAVATTLADPRTTGSDRVLASARGAVDAPPAQRVVSPIALSQLPAGQPVHLVAEANDPEDGGLGAAVRWSSSRDGALGSGARLSPALSTGIHTLTARVEDAAGAITTQTLDVEVTAGSPVLLAAGDIASCDSAADEATAALLDRRFGSIVTLGDNAYRSGSLAEFRRCYGPSWGRQKARTRPALGNHEYRTHGAAGHFAYYGAAAGDPATGWYGFDLGRWRVVVLNSNCDEIGGCTRGSPQGRWLEAELAAHPRHCALAVWHHPRFSSGGKHGSSEATRDLYAIFHAHGGDVILSGHDHDYERFAPQDSSGDADPSGPRQFVVGTGGADLRRMGEIQPNSEAHADDAHGILALTLHEASYDWEFVPAAGRSYVDAGSASCTLQGVEAPAPATRTQPAS